MLLPYQKQKQLHKVIAKQMRDCCFLEKEKVLKGLNSMIEPSMSNKNVLNCNF